MAVKDTLFLQGSKLMALFVNNMKMKTYMDINNVMIYNRISTITSCEIDPIVKLIFILLLNGLTKERFNISLVTINTYAKQLGLRKGSQRPTKRKLIFDDLP